MNVLAHLHLASLAKSSIIGNAAADFVKGDPYQQYVAIIADGIMMHRRLDKLIDNLPEVKHAKSLFQPQHQRVASITLDIVWDHFLSKYWRDFNQSQSVIAFNEQMRAIIMQDIHLFPTDFHHFMGHLWQGEWLINYANLPFIAKVLNGMANRRPKLNILRDTYADITQHYHALEALFFQLYPQLMHKAIAGSL